MEVSFTSISQSGQPLPTSPYTAPARSKMAFASSKDALRRALNGIAADIQGTDFFEVAYDPVLERVSRVAGSH
ncbi:hypothetical protein OXX79_012524 [Metschnikowia pulcherrima]